MDLSLQPQQRNGLVVQLVRMPPCHGGGRGFESRPVRKKLSNFESFFVYTRLTLLLALLILSLRK